MMLVECASSSTNNGSALNSSTGSSIIKLPIVGASSTPSSEMTSNSVIRGVSSKTSLPTNSFSALSIRDENGMGASTSNIAVPGSSLSDTGFSSGSNSQSDSLGPNLGCASNSISNDSSSIANSWHINNKADKAVSCVSDKSNCSKLLSNGSSSKVSPLALCSPQLLEANNRPKHSSPISDGKCCQDGRTQYCERTASSKLVDESCFTNTPPHLLIRSLSSLSQQSSQLSTLPQTPESEETNMQSLQKGVLQQARDRLFSRWKERYFVLTRDYLAGFRRGSTKYSEMGSFIFKVNLASVEGVWWEERRGGSVVAVGLPREGRVLLRSRAPNDDSGLQVWYRALLDATTASRLRRTALRRGASTSYLHINHMTTLTHHSSSCSSSNGNCESDVLRRTHLHQSTLPMPGAFQRGSLNTDPPSTPPSSLTSAHQFSTNTSSGSGCGSSVSSSPGLGTNGSGTECVETSSGWSPRSRFSLVESPRRLLQSATGCAPKTRHSLCLDPSNFSSPVTRILGSRTRSPSLLLSSGMGSPLSCSSSVSSTPTASRTSTSGFPAAAARRFLPSPAGHSRRSVCIDSLSASRTSLLSLTPRNPLVELLENPPTLPSRPDTTVSEHREDSTENATAFNASPESASSLQPAASLPQPKPRTSLGLLRNTPIYN